MANITGGPLVLRDGTVFCGLLTFASVPAGQIAIHDSETRLSQAFQIYTTALGTFVALGVRAGNYVVTFGGDTATITVPEDEGDYIFEDRVTDASTWVFAGVVTPATLAVGFTVTGGTVPKTLTVPLDATVSGTNTGDQNAPKCGSWDDPNGNYVPPVLTAGALYYKDQASPVIFWAWSVANQNWFPLIT